MLCGVVHQRIGSTGEYSVLFDDEGIARMLRGLFDSYYAQVPPGTVVFDTNRTWTSRAALLGRLYPKSKIICCVREIGWILDSLERMRNKNPLKLSKLFNNQTGDTLYARVEALMNSDTGLIGAAWSALREAWFSEAAEKLIIVPYDTFVVSPDRTIRRIYELLNEPPFDHDFNNVAYEAPEYDTNLGMPGLHTVHPVVAPRERLPCIPPDLFTKYSKTHFWMTAGLNPRGVIVL